MLRFLFLISVVLLSSCKSKPIISHDDLKKQLIGKDIRSLGECLRTPEVVDRGKFKVVSFKETDDSNTQELVCQGRIKVVRLKIDNLIIDHSSLGGTKSPRGCIQILEPCLVKKKSQASKDNNFFNNVGKSFMEGLIEALKNMKPD